VYAPATGLAVGETITIPSITVTVPPIPVLKFPVTSEANTELPKTKRGNTAITATINFNLLFFIIIVSFITLLLYHLMKRSQ
jgi:hypothetical protein